MINATPILKVALRNAAIKAVEHLSAPDADVVTVARQLRDTAAMILAVRQELQGKNLACWCKPGEPCHADVLLELANEKEGK